MSAFRSNPLETASISADTDFFFAFEDSVNITRRVNSISEITEQFEKSKLELTNPILIGNQEVTSVIAGTSNREIIHGTSAGDILIGGGGKDFLKGLGGADGFYFKDAEEFDKKKADKIVDFNFGGEDVILVDKEVIDLGNKIKLKVVTGKKSPKKQLKELTILSMMTIRGFCTSTKMVSRKALVMAG